MEDYRVDPKKSLGQNFLINPGVCEKIVDALGIDDRYGVIEIGAGRGVLTRQLAPVCQRLIAVELDRDLIPELDALAGSLGNVELVQGDILKIDVGKLIEDRLSGMPVAIVGNIPYYLTSPLIFALLEQRVPCESIVFMIQREVALRLCAMPGLRAVGASTLVLRYYAEPEHLFDVSPGSFYPAPKVTSSVIRLRPRQQPPLEVSDEQTFFQIIRGVFQHRRKTLINSLKLETGLDKTVLADRIAEAGLSETIRPEKMTLADFARLTDALTGDGYVSK